MTIEEFVAKRGFTGTPAGERMEADLRDMVEDAKSEALQQFFQPAPATSSAPYEYSDRIHQPEWAVGPPHIGQREDCGPCNDYVERMRD